MPAATGLIYAPPFKNYVHSNDAERSSSAGIWVKMKETRADADVPGFVVQFDVFSSGIYDLFGWLYLNGVRENVCGDDSCSAYDGWKRHQIPCKPVASGTLIQVWGYSTNVVRTVKIRNMKIYYTSIEEVPFTNIV